MPPGPRPGRSGATRSSISRSTVSNEAADCCAERLDFPEELLGDPFDIGGLDLPLVRLHDVADQATDLLGVGDPERGEALADERAQKATSKRSCATWAAPRSPAFSNSGSAFWSCFR